jgi:uncharacterized delta-60 repeat protein
MLQEPKEVQFNIENTTNQPVTIDLFDASSLTPVSSSSNFSTSSSPSNVSGGTGDMTYLTYDSVSNLINVTSSNDTISFFNPLTQSFSNGVVININTPASYNFNPSKSTQTSLSGYIYVGDEDTGVVRVINPNNNQVISSIDIFYFTDYSIYVSYNQKSYFTRSNLQLIFVIDTTTNTLETTLDLSTLPNITDLGSMTFNSINNQLYISPYNGGYYTYILDVNTNTFSESDLGIANPRTNCIVFNPTNNCLYFETYDFTVTNISVYDCNTNSFLTNIEIVNYSSLNDFDNGVYCPVNNSVYFYNIGTDSVYVIDCSTNTLTDTIAITSNDNISYGIVYSSIDNSVYISTASTLNVFDQLQKIDCSTNTLSNVSVNTTAQNLSNSTQNTLNGDVYIYSETQDIVSVYNSAGVFITNITGIGNVGAGRRSGILYIEFFNCVIVNADDGIYLINCVNNSFDNTIPNTFVANVNYELIYDEFVGLLYVIEKGGSYNIYKYDLQGFGIGNEILNQNILNPTNSVSKVLINENIYSNFTNRNFLNVVDNPVELINFYVENGSLYGVQYQKNIFKYNISSNYFDGNVYLSDYTLNNRLISFNYSSITNKIYSIVLMYATDNYYLYELNSSSLQVERTFNLTSLELGQFMNCLVISDSIIIAISEIFIYKINLTTLTYIDEIDVNSLGYSTPIFNLSYSSNYNKLLITTTSSFFFVDVDTFTPTSETFVGTGSLQTIYLPLNNQFYSLYPNEIYVIDSDLETVTTTISLTYSYNLGYSNLSFSSFNNLIYYGGNNGTQGIIEYIDPLSNTIIFTDTLTELDDVTAVCFDSSSNSMYLGGTSTSSSNILNYTCVNPLSETPVKTQITTQSKTLEFSTILLNQGVTTSSLNGYTYISSDSQNYISVFDNNNQLVTEISIPNPYLSIYVESLDYLYVIQPNAGTTDISIINCATNTILNTTTLPDYPFNLLYNSSDNKVYVTCTNNLIRLENDLSSYTQYAYSSPVNNSGITLNTQNNLVYISGIGSSTIYVFNCNTLTFDTDIVIFDDNISNPSLNYNETNNFLYTFDNDTVSVIDCTTNTLLKSVNYTGTNTTTNNNLTYSIITSDNMLVFSAKDSNDLTYLVFLNCDTNEISYSRYIESVSSGNNLNSNKYTGNVQGITYNSFDNSLRILSGKNNNQTNYQNLQTLLTISLQQTNYYKLSFSSNDNVNLGDIDSEFNIGLGTNGGDTLTGLVLSDGSVYYGGFFTEWNGVACGSIARVLSDGSYDTSFNQGTGFSSIVNVIKKQSDNKIICGGDSTSYNGSSIGAIARINTNGSLDTSFIQGTGFDADVRDILIDPSDKIIVAGDFSDYNGNACNYIARLNSNGSFDSTFNTGTGFNGYVRTISFQSDGKIICGGGFTSFNGNSCNYIARLNSDGSFDSTFNIGTGFDNILLKVFVKPNDKILVSGTFIDFNGNTVYNYLQLNSDGSFDSDFFIETTAGHVDNSIFDIYSNSNGLIYLVGNFTQFFNQSFDGVIVLTSTGFANQFFDYTNINLGDKFSIFSNNSITNNKVYISGTSLNDVVYNYYTNETNLDINEYQYLITFSGGDVNDIKINNGKLLVLGDFTSYLNYTISGLIQINTDGTIDGNFNNFLFTGFTDVSSATIQSDGKILLVGGFTNYDGNTIGNILRINSDGSYDSTFNTGLGFNNYVRKAIIQSDGKIICVGDFTDFDGNTCGYIARLNSDGSYDSTFVTGTGFNTTTRTTLIQSDGKIIVGGNFTFFDGNSCDYIARLNSDGSFDNTFSISFDDVVNVLENYNDKFYVAGNFTDITFSSNTYNQNRLIRLNSDWSYDSTFSTLNDLGEGFNAEIFVVTQLSDGNLFIGGNFGTYAGVFSQRGIIITNDGSIFSKKSPNLFDSEVLTCIELDGKLYAGGNFTDYFGESCGRFVVIDYSQNVVNTLKNLDIISTTFPLNINFPFYGYNYDFGLMYFNIINSYLYVALQNNNTVLVLDSNNNYSLVSSITLPTGSIVSSFALNPENNILAIGTSTYQLFSNYTTPNYGIPVSGGLIMLNSQTNTINQILSTLNNSGVSFLNYSPISGNFVYGGLFYSNSSSTFLSFALPSSTFTISGGSVNYNFFVQSLNNDPKKIEQIELVMPQRYLANPVNVQYTDASGISNLNPFLPNTDIDTFQKATNRAVVKFGDEYIMNINTKIVNFVLPPLSTTVLVITYQELLKSDMLDAVVYANDLKAKYKINQDANSGVITAEKYWGAKKMPKNLSLGKDWLADMKQKFSKVELLQYDLPKLAGGTATTREIYADLFGFKKQVKKKNISILKTKKKKVKIKKNVDVKLATKKQSIKPKPIPKTSLEIFTDLIKSDSKFKNIEVKENKNFDLSLPLKNKNGILIGVKDKNSNYSIYLLKSNLDRFTALRFIGNTDVKIELKKDWIKDINSKFKEFVILELGKK